MYKCLYTKWPSIACLLPFIYFNLPNLYLFFSYFHTSQLLIFFRHIDFHIQFTRLFLLLMCTSFNDQQWWGLIKWFSWNQIFSRKIFETRMIYSTLLVLPLFNCRQGIFPKLCKLLIILYHISSLVHKKVSLFKC